MSGTILKIENLSKSFGENTVLKDINLELKEGEILGLVGENGAGKSTLMKNNNGVDIPNSFFVYQDTYIFGKGYMGITSVEVPEKYGKIGNK